MRSAPADDDQERTAAGRVLDGRYELVRLLGRGTVGEVHCAHDRVLGRDVAVKLFRAGLEGDQDQERRQAEMRLLARLSHPHVVPAYDAGEHEGLPYLVMQLVHGRTLAECLPLPPDRAANVGSALASALAHVHEQGVVHRDLKPANVLLGDEDGGVWHTHFGIAKLLDSASRTGTGVTVGTASYLSPEQVRGEAVGPPSDVYALGLVLLEALTGQRAYPGTTTEAALARLTRPPEIPADLPAPWPELLAAMTADDPARRPTAEQVCQALSASPTTVSPAPVATAAARPARPAAVPLVMPQPSTADRPGRGGVLREVVGESLQSRAVQGLLGALAVVALLIATVVLAVRSPDTEPAVARPESAAAPGGGKAAGGAGTPEVRIAAVRLFHPGGSDDDSPQDAALAADGRAETAWISQRYASPTFGNLRPGVGLLYDLGKPVAVSELRLQLPHPGSALRVHAGDTADDALLRTRPRAQQADAPGRTVLKVTGAAARYWVVWFERLPERGQRRAGISETRFVGR